MFHVPTDAAPQFPTVSLETNPFALLKKQPHPQALMRYGVNEGGLEPSAIARGLAKNGKFPDQGVFIPDFAEGKLAL